MKRIMTALNNPNLNDQLKKRTNIEVIGKDIQYKEAVIDILKKEMNIDFIIINEKIPGEITLIELIKEIYRLKKETKIIVILEKENDYIERKLKDNKVKSVYYNNKMSSDELIKIIEEKEIDEKEELKLEIKRLKEIINKRSKKDYKYLVIEKVNEIINKKKRNTKREKNKLAKTILFTGNSNKEISKEILIFREFLNNQNFKVLIINLSSDNNIFEFIFDKKINKKIIRQETKKCKEKYIGNIINELIKLYSKKIQKVDDLTYINKNIRILIKNKAYFINEVLKTVILENKEEVDYILINIDRKKIICNKKIPLYLFDYIYIIEEPIIINIINLKNLIDKLKNKKKIRILFNNYSRYSINLGVIRRMFSDIIGIYKVNYNPIYNIIFNRNNYGIKKILKKHIEKEYKSIIKEIV